MLRVCMYGLYVMPRGAGEKVAGGHIGSWAHEGVPSAQLNPCLDVVSLDRWASDGGVGVGVGVVATHTT